MRFESEQNVGRGLPFARYEAFLAMTMTSAMSTFQRNLHYTKSTRVMAGSSSETSVSATLHSVTKHVTRAFLDFFLFRLSYFNGSLLTADYIKEKKTEFKIGGGKKAKKTQAKEMARGEKGTQIVRPHYLEMGL